MKTYRYGYKKNLMGNSWFSIERKFLFVWIEVFTFSKKDTMMEVVNQIKNGGNIIYEV